MKLGNMKDVRIPVEVVLGETSLTLEGFSTIGPGTIIELSSLAGEPVVFVAAGKKMARGEVVVIDENFGIRITEMLNGGS